MNRPRTGAFARALTIIVLAAAISAPALQAVPDDEWPQFRGRQAGVAPDDSTLPERWSETENVVWKIDIPGLGWSSPIVWGDVIFLTAVISAGEVEVPKSGLYLGGERPTPSTVHRWMVYAIDFTTGRTRWAREVHAGVPSGARHLKNTYASPTPVTDGERVYVFFGDAGLYALDFSGNVVWSKTIPGANTRNGWGGAASPVLHDNRLIIVNDNNSRSYIAAFDARTGRDLWRTDRDEGTNWSTPFVWQHEQGTEIVTSGTDKVRSYSLDGGLRWELKGMSTIAVPTPFAKHGLLYISSGYPGDALRPVYAVKPGASGNISLEPGATTNRFIVWSNPQLGSYNTTALVYGDHYYTLLDRGFLLCHDARTGQQVYGRQRLSSDASGFTASPWAYNGKIFAASEDGDTYVLQAGPEFKLIGKNSLNEMIMASPAIARGSLILRTASKLYRIATVAR